MFSGQSSIKRKCSEYHDPDYPPDNSSGDHDDRTICNTGTSIKKQKVVECTGEEKSREKNTAYFQKVRDIVESEFNRELAFKHHQVEQIDERIENAKDLLDKLRYALVASYYKKQDLPLAAVDASTLRIGQSFYTREDNGPQMQIHPSLKKLMGKKPRNLSDVVRSCPKRTAAQNAVQTIRAKSDVQKREERKLKQIIRGQGIVIDHSIEKETKTNITNLLNAAKRSRYPVLQPSSTSHSKPIGSTGKEVTSKPLVGARLNNKLKHLIVVGNTSKSIIIEQEEDPRNTAQLLTHKWLVYVQAKDAKVPIERFVKKIRFHLHHSYRPNDIVDVLAPPFHVARRGWGEFPIRVQLFFHEQFHQKPVQLVHNVILDKTMSGIQTLGAETLLEVWLRDVMTTEHPPTESNTIHEKAKVAVPQKQRVISRSEELDHDNLLDFLNKIEATHSPISADIEKIQPTVVVTEPLSVKTPSPVKAESTHHISSLSPTKIQSKKGKNSYVSALCTLNKLNVESNSTTHNTTSTITTSTNASHGKLTRLTKLESSTKESQGKDNGSNRNQQLVVIPSRHKQIESTQIHTSAFATKKVTVDSINTENLTTDAIPKYQNISSGISATKPKTTFIKINQNSPIIKMINNSNKSSLQNVTPAVSVALNKDGKIVMPINSITSAVRRTILPVVSSSSTINTTNTLSSSPTSVSRIVPVHTNSQQILQKRLVQLVDASGKVKYMQMLVAPSSKAGTSTTASKNQESLSSVAPKVVSLGPVGLPTSSGSISTQLNRTTPTQPLKLSNGINTSIMPTGITMKPNIFKIIPENMQTKPQIVTFCTVMATTTTTTTTTVTSQAPISCVNRVTAIGPKSNNLPSTNIQQRMDSNSMPRNVVFQKEGKVYIIDPMQMKLKQQQKKQVSLLKPQISLLKQQVLQQKQQLASLSASPPSKPPDQHNVTALSGSSGKNIGPTLHFGVKQQRLNSINSLQLMEMQRALFEKHFLKQQFIGMRHAIEFILRRLRLIVPKDSLASAFPFVTHTLAEFQSLTAFKQRAYEWLRAKQVSRLIRSHKGLQNLKTNNQETFWSTKEISLFARQYAYTPAIKSLPKLVGNPDNSKQNFNDMVKDELKLKQSTPYDTLTDHYTLDNWINKMWPILYDHEHCQDQNQVIDVDTLRDDAEETNSHKLQTRISQLKLLGGANGYEQYLSPPSKLGNECSLVSEICRDVSVKLMPEELIPNVWHSSTQTVLAQCLNIFLQKLVRNVIALKQEESNTTPESSHFIRPADIAMVLSNSAEYDFLTNRYFGSNTITDTPKPSIKQEKS